MKTMKSMKGLAIVLVLVIWACQPDSEVSDFTGNEVTYALVPGSAYPTSGTITFKEKKDGSALALVKLAGLSGNNEHPVHLHLGDLSVPDADIAALLNPVSAASGTSETLLSQWADETPLSYADILALNASIKIHLAETGTGRDVILAAGNIGAAASDKASAGGRLGVGVCKSE
ncbi:MAG: hypothetical protein ACK5DD_05315 [Cyclobacteriaceae bacterium]|jgi:hypothetical protein